jgi:hypothetical protein
VVSRCIVYSDLLGFVGELKTDVVISSQETDFCVHLSLNQDVVMG